MGAGGGFKDDRVENIVCGEGDVHGRRRGFEGLGKGNEKKRMFYTALDDFSPLRGMNSRANVRAHVQERGQSELCGSPNRHKGSKNTKRVRRSD